jgi:non-specific protein-tyrosine kinase
VSNEVGFTAVVLGDAPLSKALQTPAGYGGQLRVLPAGRHISNPSELLSSQRTGEILASLGEIADLVLIDSPPVLPVTDAVALAPRVDATILLVAAGQTTGKDLAHSLEVLGQVSAPVVGAVINASTPQHGYGYRYHGYHYRYPYEPYPGRSRQKDQPAGSVPS